MKVSEHRRARCTDRWVSTAGPVVVLMILAIALYARTLGYELVSDDGPLLRYAGERYRSGGLIAVLSSPFMVPSGLPGEVRTLGYYRPVALASLWLDSVLAGAFPPIYHLTNTLLHAGVTVVAYLLSVHFTGSRRTAFWCAVFFAVHPVHVESVANVANRTDLWASLFVLLAALAWARDRSENSRSPAIDRAGGAVAFTLAVLSKEVAFFLPAILLAWDAPTRRTPGAWRTWWMRNRIWMSVWGGSLALTFALRWQVAAVSLGSRGDGGIGMGHAVGIMAHYARLLLLPRNLTAYYTVDQVTLTAEALIAAAVLLGMCLVTSTGSFKRVGLLALLWTGAFLLPVSGIVPLIGAVAAERFLYLPSYGVCLVVAVLLGRLGTVSRVRALAAAVPLLIAAACALAALQRIPVWRDNLSLFSDLVRTSPRTWISFYGLGVALAEKGRYAEAVGAYREALRLKPDSTAAYNNLGAACQYLGRYPEAVEAFTRAIELKPEETMPRMNLSVSLAALGRFSESLSALQAAVRIAPRDPEIRHRLGLAQAAFGSREAALEQYRALLPLDAVRAAELLGKIRLRDQ